MPVTDSDVELRLLYNYFTTGDCRPVIFKNQRNAYLCRLHDETEALPIENPISKILSNSSKYI